MTVVSCSRRPVATALVPVSGPNRPGRLPSTPVAAPKRWPVRARPVARARTSATMEDVSRVPHEPADRPDRIVALQEEVDQLKEAVASHAVVDQAIGMV